jgi:hypothetical protein
MPLWRTRELAVRAAGVGTAGLALVAAGCGGGAPLSRSEFDAKANAVCAEFTKKLDAVPAPRTINDVPAYVVLVKPSIERGVDELASLKPPKQLEATYDSWMRTQREAITQTDELRRAAEKNDLAGVNRTIRALRDRNRRSNALAAKLGADVCAKD